jgi:micrococcal nuclease
MAFIVSIGVAGLSSPAQAPGGPPITARAVSSPATTTNTNTNTTAGAGKDEAIGPVARPASGPKITPAPTPASGPIGTVTTARVVRVVDAVTIVVAFGGRQHTVRYLGVTSPGTVGRQATAANRALVAGRTVMLEADVTRTDRSGRLLRHVWLLKGQSWTLVTLELVRRGLATTATNSPDKRYASAYAAAERQARASHLGVWAHAEVPKAKPGPKASKPPKPSKPQVARPDASDRN